MSLTRQALTFSLAFAVVGIAGDVPSKKEHKSGSESAQSAHSGVLWIDPVDIESRNLRYGSGGEKRAPHGTSFTFEQEDREGTNPKLVVRDTAGVKWKLKVGPEARPETAASRFVWAAGYFTTDDYLLSQIQIEDVPNHLHRGRSLIGDGSAVSDVRLKRNPEGYEKEGIWRWKDGNAPASREYNGLRVLMAVINNWDLKDVNNAVFEKKDEKNGNKNGKPDRLLLVSDLGASFGTIGLGWDHNSRKGNVEFYRRSKFITRETPEYVSFSSPARPGPIILFNPKEYFSRVHEEWIGRRIPRADARWMGELLGRLSDIQIRDAFRAAGYSSIEIDDFAKVMEARIQALRNL